MSDSLRPHRGQPTRLRHPWDSPGKNTGVGCHFLLQCMKVKSESEVARSCLTLSDPMDCSLQGSSVHGIFQSRVLEWGAIAFSAIPLRFIKYLMIIIITTTFITCQITHLCIVSVFYLSSDRKLFFMFLSFIFLVILTSYSLLVIPLTRGTYARDC